MNSAQDFRKRKDGVVVNINNLDHRRAKHRNYHMKETKKLIGEDGKIALLEEKIAQLEAMVKKLMGDK